MKKFKKIKNYLKLVINQIKGFSLFLKYQL